ncbi:hypothetical protein OOK31_16490 [Streptomyces sp. NBC_00249]|uniref:hypothetical protein n=1 Tax=Streptomyces sp. NBC_00249 TaxID=2975690 RepID=UPI002252ADD6|nr:hypothetical protein [Streptomyces sp. NBC_00249]MCX5195483.1 hypothetical protein [Streptomyces sp. NBC_00249]
MSAPAPAPAPAAPSVHRRALITWLAVYPTITVALALLRPVMQGVPLPVQTLVLTAIAIPLVVYLLVPALLKANAALSARSR